MTASKLNKEDAQEWLESLQQVGEGWYRQVALAVRAGAHKALGMERREFARQIGQRMVDPREAIIELHREGYSYQAIADVLGVSVDYTVQRVLAEEGLIEWRPDVARKALQSGHQVPETAIANADQVPEIAIGNGDAGSDVDVLQGEIDRLTTKVKGEQAKRKREVAQLNAKIKDYQQQLVDEAREARKAAEAELTEQERERARKEADAWAAEQGAKIAAGVAHLVVGKVTAALEDAREGLRLLIEQGGTTTDHLNEIEAAHAAFVEELNVARMSERTV